MKKITWLPALMLLALPLVGHAQQVVRLGTTVITNDANRTGLNIPNTCGVKKIKLTNYGGRTLVNAVVVDYQAAGAQRTRLQISKILQNGESTGWLDLPGQARCVDKLIVIGESLGSNRPSIIDIQGQKVAANPTVLLGTARISEGRSIEYVNVRNVCGIKQVKVQVKGDSARIDYIAVRFAGTGNFQQIHVRDNFRAGSESSWKDLNGGNRCIDSFFVVGKSSSRPRDARVQLIGK